MMDTLHGQVERITYANEENGYSIIKVKVRGAATWSRWWAASCR